MNSVQSSPCILIRGYCLYFLGSFYYGFQSITSIIRKAIKKNNEPKEFKINFKFEWSSCRLISDSPTVQTYMYTEVTNIVDHILEFPRLTQFQLLTVLSACSYHFNFDHEIILRDTETKKKSSLNSHVYWNLLQFRNIYFLNIFV